MEPFIVDEKAREVYGSAFVSREFAVQQGMSGYVRNIEAINRHPRVAGKPLAVKGLGTVENRPSTIIISNADDQQIFFRFILSELAILKSKRSDGFFSLNLFIR